MVQRAGSGAYFDNIFMMYLFRIMLSGGSRAVSLSARCLVVCMCDQGKKPAQTDKQTVMHHRPASCHCDISHICDSSN